MKRKENDQKPNDYYIYKYDDFAQRVSEVYEVYILLRKKMVPLKRN